MKIRKKKLIGIIVILIIVFGVIFGVGNYFYNVSISNANSKKEILSQQDNGKKFDEYEKIMEDAQNWYDKNKSKVDMKSVSNFDVVAYEFVHKDVLQNKWFIAVHGYGSSSRRLAPFIKGLYEMGYNVLSPDLIGLGDSKGNFISMGSLDAYDLINWEKYLIDKDKNVEIALFGVSMGATTVMNSLDKGTDNHVKLFIEDSGYYNLMDEFGYQIKKLYHLPGFPILNFASIVTKIRAGYFFEDVDLKKPLSTTKIPGLIIQGDADEFVPPYNAQKIYDTLSSEKEIHIFKNASHLGSQKIYRDEYWNLLKNFINKHFN